jgi:hypothetical protein
MATFEQELQELIERRLPHEELEPLVKALHEKYGRELPPAITGTLEITEPEDKLR